MRRVVLTLLIAIQVAGCGFHLRGAGDVALPESLTRLRVLVEDSKLANDPLLAAVKNALQFGPKVEVTDAADAPTLILSGERSDTQVLSVNSTGHANGYTLRYEVMFRLVDAKGKSMLEPKRIRLLRDYTFDPFNVLAKQQEEQELKRVMQNDAVQQILRQLSRFTPVEKTYDEKTK